jgi:hypothetical protein
MGWLRPSLAFLCRSAQIVAERNGHELGPWLDYDECVICTEEDYGLTTYIAKCKHCDSYITVTLGDEPTGYMEGECLIQRCLPALVLYDGGDTTKHRKRINQKWRKGSVWAEQKRGRGRC